MKKMKIRTITYRLLALLLVATTIWTSAIMATFATSDETTEAEPICGNVAHTHTQESCYTQTKTLICELEADDKHTHGGTCYEYENKLICEQSECEAHTHEDSCYTADNTVSCGKNETSGHTHGEGCYELQATKLLCKIHVHNEECYQVKNEVTCQLVEHTHTEECYDLCTCTPVDGVHQEGCALCVTPKCEHCGVELIEGTAHAEDCLTHCTCGYVNKVHTDGCPLYVSVEKCEHCGAELVENAVHAEDCFTRCTCGYTDEIHQEGCALYQESDLTQKVISSGSASVSGELPGAAELIVAEPTAEALALVPLKENEKLAFAYDISILVEGVDYQPGSAVEVTVPVQGVLPKTTKLNLIVYHITDNGTVEIVPGNLNSDGTVTFWATGFSTYVGTLAVDEATVVTPTDGEIVFDLYYGSVNFTDDAFAGYSPSGQLITGEHIESTRYIIQQTNAATPTANTIAVGMYKIDITLPDPIDGSGNPSIETITSTPVNKSFLIELAEVNINAADQCSALSVNNEGESVVAVILKNGTTNYLYSGINRAGLEKSGGYTSDGTLVLTCEAGYTAWLSDPNAGHTDFNHFSACNSSVCGTIDARSGNAWYNSDQKNSYYGGAGIGTHGSGSGGSSAEGVLAGNNALVNLTIAGGNIYALGARGNAKSTSSGGGANIGTGSARTSGETAGTINGLKITGGTIQLWRGDHSAACIGGGYRSGYVNMEIFGGTIFTRDMKSSYTTLTKINKVRASGIGGGGGGSSSNSPAGASVTIYGGEITTSSQYGAAIGSGAGGDGAGSHTGNASAGIVNIHGGTIYATTTSGAGSGAGAAIGAGGSLGAGKAGNATVNIYDGTIVASSALGADIGGGGTNSTETTGIGGDGTVTITGGTITAMSGGIGGGRANAGVGGEADVTISGGTITASAVGAGDSKQSDGGNCTLVISGGTMTVNNQTGVSIGGGNGGTGGNGGNATLDVSGTAVLYAGSIGGGSTTNESGNIGSANVTISGGSIQGQVIMAAGADTACSFTMTGGTFDNSNRETNGFYFVKENGGAVYMDDPNGIATISGGTIQNCSAGNGGAVYMTAGAFTMSGKGTIQNCTASGNGGAVYLGGGTVTVSGGTIAKNTAVNGGAAYLGGGTMTVSGGSIQSNTASANGGGAYLSNGSLTVSNGTITENTAVNGGAAYLDNGTLTVSGGSITANNASNNGGGAFASGGVLKISSGSVSGNTAVNNGGGAYVENGNIVMSGGAVDGNRATNGAGGGMYVSTNGSNVGVTVYSGSVNGNTAKTSGGAVAVVGTTDGEETITVTLGLNALHSYTDNVLSPVSHSDSYGEYTHSSCPVIQNNSSSVSGGGVYITGGSSTNLNIYCLDEINNQVGDGTSLSNFMMVEGGTVKISSSNPETGEGSNYGNTEINGTVHVRGGNVFLGGDGSGDVTLSGATSNPKFNSAITVDVTDAGGSFKDYREGDTHYKLLYFENFKDSTTGNVTGQYTAYQYPRGSEITISGVIYSHPGYEIVCWYTEPTLDGSGTRYEVGKTYPLDSDLTIYAIWEAHGYTIAFDPNVPVGETYTGVMSPQTFNYNVEGNLAPNTYKYPGYIFAGWNTSPDGRGTSYVDGNEIFNLTTEDGAVITLYAKWTKCLHDSSCAFIYTVAAENILRRDCSCEGQTLYAILSAEDAVYDGNFYPAQVGYTDASNWDSEIIYIKENDETFSGIPKDAGTYTAMISDGDEHSSGTISVTYTIAKADQDPPNTPTFTVDGNTLSVTPVNPSLAGTNSLYQLVYFTEDGKSETGWTETLIYTLETSYTSYYICAKYDGNNNYNPSPVVRSEQTYYYKDKDTVITIKCAEGISYKLEEVDNGLKITSSTEQGYYFHEFKAELTEGVTQAALSLTVDGLEKVCLLSEIVSGARIRVELTGAKKAAIVSCFVTENQVFGTVTGTSATISCDSAFTAYYSVSGYDAGVYDDDNMQLKFIDGTTANTAKKLPYGTTIILLNKADGSYWSYAVTDGNGTDTIPLSAFTRMGGTNPFDVSGTELAYQFIVDFSRSAGCDGTRLNMVLATTKDASAANAPDFSPEISVTLKDASTFSMTAANEEQSNKLTLTYNSFDGVASKWDNRNTALVLTPSSAIPSDTTLLVTRANGQTYWPMSGNGTYIIPLSLVGSETLTVELVSALLPTGDSEYKFEAVWFVSNSKAAKAPMIGAQVAQADVTITKSKATAPSMKITGTQRLLNTNDTLAVDVDYILPTNGCTVTAVLMRKGESGKFSSTAWTQSILAQGTLTVPMGGQTPGSFCLTLTMKQGVDTILQVPYYFIVQ